MGDYVSTSLHLEIYKIIIGTKWLTNYKLKKILIQLLVLNINFTNIFLATDLEMRYYVIN